MKSDYTTNSRYITHTVAFWKVGRIHFLSSGVKGLKDNKHRNWSLLHRGSFNGALVERNLVQAQKHGWFFFSQCRFTFFLFPTSHLRDRRTNARRWRDSWLDCQGVFVTQCSVDPDCATHGCARLFGWRSWTDRRCWNGAGRRGGFYCRRRVSCFAVKLPKFVLGAKRVCGTRPSRTRSQFSFFHRFVFLVYTTQVNSSFRAIWLFPLSRDIKYYSPPGGFQKKNCA